MGACALLLGPMQFSDRLRRRFTKFHRVVGRFYVAGVFAAAPLGFYIQHFEERLGGTRSFSFAAATDAALWMFTPAIALIFILRGNVQQHRQWMTRSFAVAIVFLEVRVVGGVTGWENLSQSVSETIVWMCVAFSLLSPTSSSNGRSFPARALLLPARGPHRASSELPPNIPREVKMTTKTFVLSGWLVGVLAAFEQEPPLVLLPMTRERSSPRWTHSIRQL